MTDTVTTLAQKLRPFWLRDLAGGSTITLTGGGGGGGLAEHALNGIYHVDELDPSQAPWAVTDDELIAHALLADVHHARSHEIFSLLDHTLTSAALGLIGAVSVNTMGLITPSSDVATTPVAAVLASDGAGQLGVAHLFTTEAYSLGGFASGFAGYGWRVDIGITTPAHASIETDDLTVRGRMRVYELLIQQIRATNGSVFVSSASKAKDVIVRGVGTENPFWTVNGEQLYFNGQPATLTFTFYPPWLVNGVQLTFNGEDATFKATFYTINTATAEDLAEGNDRRLYHGFLVGDVIRSQEFRWDGSGFASITQSNLEVTSVTNLYIYGAAHVSGDVAEKGMDFVRLGSTSDVSRQGAVYLTSDDSGAPFIDIVDGIRFHSDWNTAGKIKARLGKLSGISDSDFGGALEGYGLYSQNVYLKGKLVIAAGSEGYINITDRPTSLTGINSTEGAKLTGIEAGATYGATWGTNLLSIPATLGAPAGTGLFLSATHMGFYTSSAWKTYIDNTGNMILGDFAGGSPGLAWNQGTGVLSIRGSITLTNTISAGSVSGLGDLALLDGLAAGDISGLGALATQNNLDGVPNGATYGKVLVTSISAGKILLAQVDGTLDNLANGATYGRVLLTSISAGKIVLAQVDGTLDNLADGSTYGKVKQTILGAGFIQVGTGTKDSSLNGWSIDNTEIVGQTSGVDQIRFATSGMGYFGANTARLASDGQRFVLPDTTSLDVSTSSSALRWFPAIDGTHDNSKNYTGLVSYRNTILNTVDALTTCFIGSTNYATYNARVMLQAGHWDGSAYTDARLEVIRERGTGLRYVGIYGDRLEVNGAMGLIPITAPAAWAGGSLVYLNSANGDLEVIFSNGTTKTLATN